MSLKKLFLIILMVSLPLAGYPQFKDYKVKGGVQFDYVLPFSEFTSDQFSFLGRGFFAIELNRLLDLEIGGGYGQYKVTDDFTGNPGAGLVSTDIIPLDVRLRIEPFKMKTSNPYFYFGAGLMRYDVKEGLASNDQIVKELYNGWTGYIPFGAGIEIKLSDNVLFDIHAGGAYTFSDQINNYVFDNFKEGMGHAGIGFTFTGSGPKDSDMDGLMDDYEESIGTDPENPDTDGDGLKDGEEVKSYKTNPLNKDTDGDGLNDGDEVKTYYTEPTNPDTDGDGLKDGEEVNTYRTDPRNTDSDYDGLSDGAEVLTYKTNPLKADTDGDNLNDGEEVNTYKTNPLKADTDGGSVNDGIEVTRGTNPLDATDDVEKPKMEVGAIIVLEGINFETGKSTITPDSEDKLEDALKTLKENPEIEVEISGHTDITGSRNFNMRLSQNRADAVKDWLVGKGIDGSRISTVGYGPDRPIAPNDTPENMYKNRRIEFKRVK